MSEADLHVESRTQSGSAAIKALRRAGQVPGIFYSQDKDSVLFSVDKKALRRLLQQNINILNVILPDGVEQKCIVREVQQDPVSEAIIHVDLMGIKLTEKVRLTIPIILKGIPVGVKTDGGMLEHHLREVEVEGLPLDIPETLEIDVTALKLGQSIALKEIPAEKFRFIMDTHHSVATVIVPKVVKEAEVVEAQAETAETAEGESEAAA
jgi:large subunit ribosomal protein L25